MQKIWDFTLSPQLVNIQRLAFLLLDLFIVTNIEIIVITQPKRQFHIGLVIFPCI